MFRRGVRTCYVSVSRPAGVGVERWGTAWGSTSGPRRAWSRCGAPRPSRSAGSARTTRACRRSRCRGPTDRCSSARRPTRRCEYEPALVARYVVSRLGDGQPIDIDGHHLDPLALTRAVLREAIERAAPLPGVAPDHVVVTYPLLPGVGPEELIADAAAEEFGPTATLVPAPVAAVARLAAERGLGDDAVVAVVDVGGSSVDVALVRRTPTAFDLVGDPATLADLGGVDLDGAVLSLVEGAIGDVSSMVAPGDSAAMLALRRLRASCRAAKERLSVERHRGRRGGDAQRPRPGRDHPRRLRAHRRARARRGGRPRAGHDRRRRPDPGRPAGHRGHRRLGPHPPGHRAARTAHGPARPGRGAARGDGGARRRPVQRCRRRPRRPRRGRSRPGVGLAGGLDRRRPVRR